MQFADTFCGGKPDPVPGVAAGAGAVGAVKHFKNAFQFALGDGFAVVFNRQAK